jgi:hypothetical protein
MNPIESAEGILVELVRSKQGTRGVLPVEVLPEVIREFYTINFNVPRSTDADGILFQYGVANWMEPPKFAFGFTRQFEIVDNGGEFEYHSQVSIEYRYTLDSSLKAVSSRESWWFYGSQDDFGGWLDGHLADPIWEELQDRAIGEVIISQEAV